MSAADITLQQEPAAFTAEPVCRPTELSRRQLASWASTGFVRPEYEVTGRRAFARIYSFRDLVALRTLALLGSRYHTPLQALKRELVHG